jgi:hypothetical protein
VGRGVGSDSSGDQHPTPAGDWSPLGEPRVSPARGVVVSLSVVAEGEVVVVAEPSPLAEPSVVPALDVFVPAVAVEPGALPVTDEPTAVPDAPTHGVLWACPDDVVGGVEGCWTVAPLGVALWAPLCVVVPGAWMTGACVAPRLPGPIVLAAAPGAARWAPARGVSAAISAIARADPIRLTMLLPPPPTRPGTGRWARGGCKRGTDRSVRDGRDATSAGCGRRPPA